MDMGITPAAEAGEPGQDALVLDAALFERVQETFAGIEAWHGFAPKERRRNFLGAVMPDERAAPADPDFEEIEIRQGEFPPPLGEGFFEFYSLISSVREARGRYVMISLGANEGRPLVNAALAIRRINPMPIKLVGIEGDHHMCQRFRRHFLNNGIDPNDHTIINAVVSNNNRPLIFPTAEACTGANFALHPGEMTDSLFEIIRDNELCERVLENLFNPHFPSDRFA